MATQTLAQAAKFIDDKIVKGVAETIVTTNPIYTVLPWTGYEGQAIVINSELALGDAEHLAIGGTITAKSAPTYTSTSYTAVTTVGDAEMNGLVEAQSSSAGDDIMGKSIASKAKSIGRLLQTGIATGDGVSPNLNSVHTLCDAGQYTSTSAGQALSFALIDELLDLVKSKDGEVDYIMAPGKIIRAYRTLVRALGGTNETTVYTMPFGITRNVDVYNNIPMFQNDYISLAETANGTTISGGALTSMYAGNWDDGTNTIGASMIHPMGIPAGVAVENVGVSSTKDERIVRVKSYSNFVLYNKLGLARLPSLNNS